MTRAYSDVYLDEAVIGLGEAVEYADYACGIGMDRFMSYFIVSGFAERFGDGDPRVIAGMDGTELAKKVLEKVGIPADAPPLEPSAPSPEYWCGWVLALYQWASGRSFKDILSHITMDELLQMYPTLHEASEQNAVETIDGVVRSRQTRTNLQNRRILAGYTQKELSEESGVNLRTLQQYETGAKDVDKASGETLRALSRALSCRMEDLLEARPVEPFRDRSSIIHSFLSSGS